MSSIPFQLPDVGLSEVSGYVYLEDEFLVFEVEKSLLGEFEGDQHVIKIEPAAITEMRVSHGIFKDRLCIRPKKRDLLRAMPGNFKDELCLKFSRKHRVEAYALVEELKKRNQS